MKKRLIILLLCLIGAISFVWAVNTRPSPDSWDTPPEIPTTMVLDEMADGCHILAVRTIEDGMEHLTVTSRQGEEELWVIEVESASGTDARIGGTEEMPLVIIVSPDEVLRVSDEDDEIYEYHGVLRAVSPDSGYYRYLGEPADSPIDDPCTGEKP